MATLSEKIKLLMALLSGNAGRTAPFWVSVDVTSRCNLNCLCCSAHSPLIEKEQHNDQIIRDIPLDLFKGLSRDLYTLGTRGMTLSGEGEPFLHPHIYELISIAKEKEFQITAFTNGTLLNNKSVPLIVDSGLDILKVSLWASSAEEYQLNYPGSRPENFQKIKDGVRLLTKTKLEKHIKLPFIELYHPINRHNFQHIDAMVDLAITTGCNGLSFSPVVTNRGRFDEYILRPEEEETMRHSLIRARKRLDSNSVSHNIDQTLVRYEVGQSVWKKSPCYVGWVHTRIKTDGSSVPCVRCDFPMGNINKNKMRDIWTGEAYGEFRKKVLTKQGLEIMNESCDCAACCLLPDNLRVHQIMKWFSKRDI